MRHPVSTPRRPGLPLATRRALLAAALMAGAAGIGQALVPTRRMADQRGGFTLAAAVPDEFAGWHRDPQAPRLVANPQAEALLNRLYSDILERTFVRGPGERVMLSIAYGADQADASVQLHYPEVCYPAQGFEVRSSRLGLIHSTHGDIPVRRLETRFADRVLEPVTYWTVIGDQLSLGGLDKRLAEIRHSLRGEIVDGLLVRVSSRSSDTAAAFVLQDQFVVDLMASLTQAQRQRLAALW
jgi:EpsI family protein